MYITCSHSIEQCAQCILHVYTVYDTYAQCILHVDTVQNSVLNVYYMFIQYRTVCSLYITFS